MEKEEQIKHMLPHIKAACDNCTMCHLGRSMHTHNNQEIEPHVFSNMQVSEYVMIAQNPGFNECLQDIPLVGQAGRILETELNKYGLSRNTFYITNIVHCHTDKNRAPSSDEIETCKQFITMEMRLIRPRLVVTLGSFAFNALCTTNYADSLGKITNTTIAGLSIPVFPVYHPSPRNLADPIRKTKFEHDIKLLCAAIKRLENENAKEKEQFIDRRISSAV